MGVGDSSTHSYTRRSKVSVQIHSPVILHLYPWTSCLGRNAFNRSISCPDWESNQTNKGLTQKRKLCYKYIHKKFVFGATGPSWPGPLHSRGF